MKLVFLTLFLANLAVSQKLNLFSLKRRPAQEKDRFDSCLERLKRVDSCNLRNICTEETEEKTRNIVLDKTIMGSCPEKLSKLDEMKYDKEEEDSCVCPYCDNKEKNQVDLCIVCADRDGLIHAVVEKSVQVVCKEEKRKPHLRFKQCEHRESIWEIDTKDSNC